MYAEPAPAGTTSAPSPLPTPPDCPRRPSCCHRRRSRLRPLPSPLSPLRTGTCKIICWHIDTCSQRYAYGIVTHSRESLMKSAEDADNVFHVGQTRARFERSAANHSSPPSFICEAEGVRARSCRKTFGLRRANKLTMSVRSTEVQAAIWAREACKCSEASV